MYSFLKKIVFFETKNFVRKGLFLSFILLMGFVFFPIVACNTEAISDSEEITSNSDAGTSNEQITHTESLVDSTQTEKNVQDAGSNDQVTEPEKQEPDKQITEAENHSDEEDHDHTAKCVTIGGYCAGPTDTCKSGTKAGSAMGCHEANGSEGQCCIPTTINICKAKGGYCVKAGESCKSGDIKDSASCLDATDICCASTTNNNCVIKGGYCAATKDTCKSGYVSGSRMGCPGEHEAAKCCKKQ